MTDGLEVFVQEVMAAITTEPSRTFTAVRSATASPPPSSWCSPPSPSILARSWVAGGSAPSWKASVKLSQMRASGTRSCGRLGPATLGSTVARSSSSSSLNTGGSDPSTRNMPCDLQ